MRELEYPFNGEYLLKKKKSIKRTLLQDGSVRLRKKIAVLGGSTTDDIVKLLELFLLNYGIEAEFYESGYNRYYEDGVFGNEKLTEFAPDLVYIHTTSRNVPELNCFRSRRTAEKRSKRKLEEAYSHFRQVWEGIGKQFHCPVIQNNFEKPSYRLLGNMRTPWISEEERVF